LKILLAEDRNIRPDLREQLADDGGDTAEKMRPEAVLESGNGGPLWCDPRRKPLCVMVLTSGCQISSTRSAASLARSAFQVRRYEPKSSAGANWAGLTKIETTTLAAPVWRGGPATHAVMERTHGRHQCDAGLAGAQGIEGTAERRTVRTTMGFRGIGSSSVGVGKRSALAGSQQGGGPYQAGLFRAKQRPAGKSSRDLKKKLNLRVI